MQALLSEYRPRLIPGWVDGQHFLLVPHEGKSDLDRSIPPKLKAWREPGARFVIVRDNDNADCLAPKARLARLCHDNAREALVRLVCQELESWYLADEEALAAAYPAHRKSIKALMKRFPDPEQCQKPSHEPERKIGTFQKHDAARRMGKLLDSGRSRSRSFQVFAEGISAQAR